MEEYVKKASRSFPERVEVFGRRHPVFLSGAFLVLAQAVMSIDLWNAGVPLGDEGVHILRALAVGWSPRTWTSPFHDVYALLLAVLRDPISAHLVYRFLLAEATALILWRILLCAGFSVRASTTAGLLWIGCGLANTLVQFGNVNLFAFAVAGIGLSLILDHPTPTQRAGCVALLLVASASRVEYLAAAGLMLLVEAVRYVRNATRRRRWAFITIATAGAVAVGAIVDWRFFDRYLLFGLGQCYADFVHRHSPGLSFNPFTEYLPLLNRVFGNPQSFLDAILHNPLELARYLVLNGLRNALMVLPSILNPRRMVTLSSISVQGLVPLVVAWTGVAAGIWVAVRRTKEFRVPWGKVGYLSLLAFGVSVPVLLHIPDPRYWIGVVPVAYAGVAIAAEALLQLTMPRWVRAAIILATVVWLIRPMPWSRLDNQPALRAARAALVERSNPIIAGVFPEPWVAFIRRGQAQARNFEEIAKTPEWSLAGLDFVVVDQSLRQSKLWRDEPLKFAPLESPEYRCVFQQGALALYVSRRTTAILRATSD